MQHVPPKPKFYDIKKGLYQTLYVDETIEESLSIGTYSPNVSYIHAQNLSDTVLNSTSSYPKKSKITNNKTKGGIICHT